MLSRQVCSHCRHKHFKGKKKDCYLAKFNHRWYCPATKTEHAMESVDVEWDPPANCQYRFEHAVAAGVSDVE